MLMANLAYGFGAGGHHYTISAIYYDSNQKTFQPDAGRLVEAFCSQLPDLSEELDAITQREHVFRSLYDWQWGLLGRCSTQVSRHMVATQFYLHALTGAPTLDVRKAAENMIKDIDRDILAETNLQKRVNLYCTRGFTAHLLGDTYAHSKLKNSKVLYSTGAGHWQDMHIPDYMLSRNALNQTGNTWADWVQNAVRVLNGQNNASSITNLITPIPSSTWKNRHQYYGEHELTTGLINYLPPSMKPYNPPLLKWGEGRPLFFFPWIKTPFLTTSCDWQIRAGSPQIKGVSPQCQEVWFNHLRYAIKNFSAVNVKPDDSCMPEANHHLIDTLADGRN